jgi:hypothetical protein
MKLASGNALSRFFIDGSQSLDQGYIFQGLSKILTSFADLTPVMALSD